MKRLSLAEICEAVNGRWLTDETESFASGVTIDSRTAAKGELFIAIKGPSFDGHDFLTDAAEAGCTSALVDVGAKIPDEVAAMFEGGLIAVEDTVDALGTLASYHRKLTGDVSVIAVTGSAGKTTVKRMIHHILSRSLTGSAGPKSFNNEIGVPLTLLGASEADDYVICEIGTNHPGEVAALGEMTRPDVAVVTSVGPAHIGQFGSLEAIAKEKASLAGKLSPGGAAVVWSDSELLENAVRKYKCEKIKFGDSELAEFRLTGYQADGIGCRYQINDGPQAKLALPGRHNATNALAAIAVADRYGISANVSAAALADFVGDKMRLEWIEADSGGVINDAYNANPASVLAAGVALCDIAAERRVLVLGDMLEMGDGAEQIHRQLGAELIGLKLDLIIGVGPLGRYVAEGASLSGGQAEAVDSVESAGEAMRELIRPGDVVLVKGSRAMQMERLIEPIRAALS